MLKNNLDLAMEIAEDAHDANIGFNWAHLRAAIALAKD